MEPISQARERFLARKTPGIGRCIYCGYQPELISELTEEHIIPLGAGGTATIENASCKKCEKKTNRFETICLKTFLFPIRLKIGVQRRKRGKNKSPDEFYIIEIDKDGNRKRRLVTVSDTSMLTVFPLLLPPIKLLGTPPHLPLGLVTIGAVQVNLLGEDGVYLQTNSEIQNQTFAIDSSAFCLMLAKIAHCFLIATFGIKFEPLLSEYIIGKRCFGHNYFVGCYTPWSEKTNEDLHILSFFTTKIRQENIIVVRIRLFCPVNIPTYYVVGGLLTDNQLKDCIL